MDRAPKFHPLSFGGWQNYQDWADHGFVPRPLDDTPADEPSSTDQAEPDTSASGESIEDQDGEPSADDVPDNSDQDTVVLTGSYDFPVDVPDPLEYWLGEPEEDREPAASVARPYVRTGGRTRAVHDLRLETMVSVTPLGISRYGGPGMSLDHQLICDLCWNPASVAEIAVHIQAPIGVARILISDAISLEILAVHDVAVDVVPSLDLMQRVLDGLRRMN